MQLGGKKEREKKTNAKIDGDSRIEKAKTMTTMTTTLQE